MICGGRCCVMGGAVAFVHDPATFVMNRAAADLPLIPVLRDLFG